MQITMPTIQVTFRVPTEWGMYTNAGNRALTGHAKTVARKIEKLRAEGKLTRANVSRVLVAYLASYQRASDRRATSEASDTAVRECVGSFHDRIWNACVGYGADEAWEKHRDAAYRRTRTN